VIPKLPLNLVTRYTKKFTLTQTISASKVITVNVKNEIMRVITGTLKEKLFPNNQENQNTNSITIIMSENKHETLGNFLPKINFDTKTETADLWNQLNHTEQLLVLDRIMKGNPQVADKIRQQVKELIENRQQ
jgi:hypothetical protein